MKRGPALRVAARTGRVAALLGLVAWGAAATSATSAAVTGAAPDPVRVVYPAAPQPGDHRADYYVDLLKLALAKSDGRFQVVGSSDPSMASRAFVRMARHEGVDVIWAPTTRQFERDYRAIRVPLDKGLLGWRLLLINRADAERFAKVRTLAQFRAFRAGQAAEWSDTQVLRDNGIAVVTASLYENLFPMLAALRFDYFPRGIAETANEVRSHPEFIVEPHIVLHYPTCTYFFVARDNVALAQQLELGLHRAQQDGSLEKLFEFYNGTAVHDAGLGLRRVFELRNTVEPQTCETPSLIGRSGAAR